MVIVGFLLSNNQVTVFLPMFTPRIRSFESRVDSQSLLCMTSEQAISFSGVGSVARRSKKCCI